MNRSRQDSAPAEAWRAGPRSWALPMEDGTWTGPGMLAMADAGRWSISTEEPWCFPDGPWRARAVAFALALNMAALPWILGCSTLPSVPCRHPFPTRLAAISCRNAGCQPCVPRLPALLTSIPPGLTAPTMHGRRYSRRYTRWPAVSPAPEAIW